MDTMRCCWLSALPKQNLHSPFLLSLRFISIIPLVLCRWVLSFTIEPPTDILCWCLIGCLPSTSRVLVRMTFPPMGDQPSAFALLQPFVVYPWLAYVPPSVGLWPMPGLHWEAALLTASGRGDLILMLLKQPFSNHLINTVVHAASGSSVESHLFPLPSPHGQEWFPFKVW